MFILPVLRVFVSVSGLEFSEVTPVPSVYGWNVHRVWGSKTLELVNEWFGGALVVSFSFLTPLPCRVSLWIWSFPSKAFQVVQCDVRHWVISVFASRSINISICGFCCLCFGNFLFLFTFMYVGSWKNKISPLLPCPWVIWVRVCWFSDKSSHKHFCSSSSPSKAADDCRHLLPFHVNNLFLIHRSHALFADLWGQERFLLELVGIISSYMVKNNAPTHKYSPFLLSLLVCIFIIDFTGMGIHGYSS